MFPVMLRVQGRRCLVVGGGGVALRKIQALVAEDARVTVVAREVVEALREMAGRGQLTLETRPYRPGEAADYALVFTATDSREVNRLVYEDADGAGVWANAADDPELCSFHLPARVQRGSLQLSIASAGEAPFAVRRIRQLLEGRFGPEWAEWVEAAARFRCKVRDLELEPAERESCFDRFFDATVDPERLSARVPTRAEERSWCERPAADEFGDNPAPRAAPHVFDEARADCAPGLVSLVGAGPGCAGLLTLRGWRRLMDADAVVYDRLAAAVLPCELSPETELHCVGKTAGHHPVPQEEITAQLIRLAREGKRVVRLKGGDPFVFGRGGEELEALQAEGIPFEVVPGVTSGVAAPGWMGIPVTHRGEAVRVTLLTAHECVKQNGSQVRWDLLAQDPHSTLVGYMGVTTLPRVVESLVDGGMDPTTPAAVVERGTTASQRSVVSTLSELPAAVQREGLRAPALFVIGPTVRHAERLDWFSRQPLAGERLLISAAASELAEGLESAGAELVAAPWPMTPATRVVIGSAPLTGCVLRNRVEVEWFDDEREGPGWEANPVAWCLSLEAADRARELGWRRVRLIEEGSREAAGVVAWILRTRRRAA
ncbi:MAG: uroporphyrinogen-III C-methyltransferase [Deltaproteobacteria bacterium]|nr:uroporphyrinogen-III C-methyltransferase [Deltaproteobacteria bacterium]